MRRDDLRTTAGVHAGEGLFSRQDGDDSSALAGYLLPENAVSDDGAAAGEKANPLTSTVRDSDSSTDGFDDSPGQRWSGFVSGQRSPRAPYRGDGLQMWDTGSEWTGLWPRRSRSARLGGPMFGRIGWVLAR